jgi:hypothetical protein
MVTVTAMAVIMETVLAMMVNHAMEMDREIENALERMVSLVKDETTAPTRMASHVDQELEAQVVLVATNNVGAERVLKNM